MKPQYLKMAQMSKSMLLIINKITYNKRANASEIRSVMTRWKNGKVEYEKSDKWVYVGDQHGPYSQDGWIEDMSAQKGSERTHVFIERRM